MKYKLLCWIMLVAAFCSNVTRVEAIDPRLEWIGPQQLQKKIRTTPLASTQQHIYLLSRASSSSLDWLSYKEYTALWKKSQDAGYTNLYRGLSSLNFYNSQYSPWGKPTLSHTQLAKIQTNAGASLLRASVTLPDSAVAQLAYGYFAWQYGRKMKRGLQILEQVKRRDPKLPSVHATLGIVYGNQSGNAYDIRRAEQALLEAVRLDSKYAAPRAQLVFFYSRKASRDIPKAKQHYNIWLTLLPGHLKSKESVRQIQKEMNLAMASKR